MTDTTGAETEPGMPVVLLATDGSEDAALGRRAAVDLAGRTSAALHLVHVWCAPLVAYADGGALVPPDYPLGVQAHGEAILRREREAVETEGCPVTAAHLVEGRPADGILDTAAREDEGRSMVAPGRRGAGRMRRMLMGSVSRRLLHATDGPMLVVPATAAGEGSHR